MMENSILLLTYRKTNVTLDPDEHTLCKLHGRRRQNDVSGLVYPDVGLQKFWRHVNHVEFKI